MAKTRVKKKTDKISHVNHSMNPDRPNVSGNMRSRATIRRLKMVRNSKKRCNSKGEVVKEAAFQTIEKPGKMVHIQADRRYFGNTRVISEKDLDKFREYETLYDPYQVTLKKTLMPLSATATKASKLKIDCNYTQDLKRKPPKYNIWPGCETFADVAEYMKKKNLEYDETRDKMVTDKLEKDKPENKHLVFRAGTSHRVYKELMNVIDSSDVLLYVLDVRNPLGTRNEYIEGILKEKPNKKLVYILNKLDLVPISVTRAWKRYFSKIGPTVAFYADMKHPYGKQCLFELLKQLKILHQDRKMLNVGCIGYPNVGKSSLINALRGKKVCKVAPIAGETKVWQFVALTKSIHVIDSPGVCCSHQDTETDLIVKGAVRVEKVPDPDMHIESILKLFKPEYLKMCYGLVSNWNDAEEFIEIIAKKKGRLLKGGFPDIQTTSRMILNDFQRGELRYYFPPPNYVAVKETYEDFSEFDRLLAQKTSVKEILTEMGETTILDENDVNIDDNPSEPKLETDNAEEHDVNIDDNPSVPKLQTDNAEEHDVNIDDNPSEPKLQTDNAEELSVVDEDDVDKESTEEIIKFKPKPQKKSKTPKIEKKLTSKQRRKQERQMKNKKTGFNYYDYVDVKNKKSRKGKK